MLTEVALVVVIVAMLAARVVEGRAHARQVEKLVAAVVAKDGRELAAITRAESAATGDKTAKPAAAGPLVGAD